MSHAIWEKCQVYLQDELPVQQYNTWIRPLQAHVEDEGSDQTLRLVAPNRFIQDWVLDKFHSRISELYSEISGTFHEVVVEAGQTSSPKFVAPKAKAPVQPAPATQPVSQLPVISPSNC